MFIYLFVQQSLKSSFKTRTYSSTKVTFCFLLSGQDPNVICLSSSLKLLKLFSFLNRPNTNWGGTPVLATYFVLRNREEQPASSWHSLRMAMSGQLAQLCLCCWAVMQLCGHYYYSVLHSAQRCQNVECV